MAEKNKPFVGYVRQRIEPYKTTTLGFLAGILGVAVNLREAVSDATIMLAGAAILVAIGAGVFVRWSLTKGRNPKWACDLFLAGAVTAVVAGLLTIGQALTDTATGEDEPLVAILIPQLRSIDEGVSEIADNTAEIAVNTANAKREVSTNPRKELANLGIPWDGRNFLEAIEARDYQTMRLFLDGGMNIETASNQGMMLPVVLGRTRSDIPKVLAILSEYGLDPNHQFGTGSNRKNDKSIIGWAAQIDRPDIIKAAVEIGGDPNLVTNAEGYFGITSVETPLVAAIDHGKYKSAITLLEVGAEPSTNQWQAYGRLKNRLYRHELDRNNEDAAKLLKKFKPPKRIKKMADLGTELAHVENQISSISNDRMTEQLLGSWTQGDENKFNSLLNRQAAINQELDRMGVE